MVRPARLLLHRADERPGRLGGTFGDQPIVDGDELERLVDASGPMIER